MSGDDARTDARLRIVGRRLAAARSRDEIVAILREEARGIVDADGIAVVLRDGDVCHYVAEDAIAPLWRGRRFPSSACISGWVMLDGQTAVVPFIDFDPRMPVEAHAHTSMRSLVMVPIGAPEPAAALGAYWCAAVQADAATVCRIETLARMAEVALARIRPASAEAVTSRSGSGDRTVPVAPSA